MKILTPIILLSMASFAPGEWVDLGIFDISHARLDVLECTSSGFTVEITVPGYFTNTVTKEGMTFNTISVPSMTPYSDAEGAPMLPKASFLAAVPESPNVDITVKPIIEPVVVPGFKPYPMQPIPTDNGSVPIRFTYVPGYYDQDSIPSEKAFFEEAGVLRGVNIGRFTVVPFAWNSDTGELTIYPRVRVTVDFGETVRVEPRLRSRFFRNVYRTLVNSSILGRADLRIHHPSNEVVKATNAEEADDINAADLLIMAGDDFVDTLMNSFIQQKMAQGYLTAVVAAGSWSQSKIHDYIKNAYDNWEIPPSFILFVGDHKDLTGYKSSTGCYSDNRYVCVDGNDYIPDIHHGRLVTSADNYSVVEAKILKWQFDPLMNSDFWGHALTAGMLQAGNGTVATRWFCFTLESVRDSYMNIHDKKVQREYVKDTSQSPPYYYRDDLPSAGQKIPSDIVWDGDAAGIIEAINGGVFLVQHRDHGEVSGWADPAFHIKDLLKLNNGDKTPMVMSTNCLTGKFYDDCFAENFLCMKGGAVGVLAATEVSYSYFNDYLTYGHHKSFVDEFTSPPALYTDPSGNYLAGQALTCAKTEMYTAAPSSPYGSNWKTYAEKTYDLFHWFGDPTMDMRTEVPHDLNVSAPHTLPSGTTQATFHVSDSKGDVNNALVCISHDSLWASGLTDSTGSVTLAFDSIGSLSGITWMVTSHNALPAQGIINGTETGDEPRISVDLVGVPRPNPARELLSVPVSLSGNGFLEMCAYDVSGRLVATIYKGELPTGRHILTWDVSRVPVGIYVIRFSDSRGMVAAFRTVVSR